MTAKRLEGTTVFQNAIDTVFDYKAHTATYEHAAGLVMELVRC